MTTTSALFAASDAVNGNLPAAAFGSADLGASFAYPGPANTWVDTGLAATIDSNGVWSIVGQLRTSHRQQDGIVMFALFDDSVSTTVPITSSETEPGFTSGSNNVNDDQHSTGAYAFRYTLLGGVPKTLKLKMKCTSFNAASAFLYSDGNGRSRLTWEKVSGFTALTTTGVMETGEAILSTAAFTIAPNNTDMDVPGCTTPILGAGVWRIDAWTTCEQVGSSNTVAWLTDQSNAVVPKSSFFASRTNSATLESTSSISIDVVSDGSKSYKLRTMSNSAVNLLKHADHAANNSGIAQTTKIRWTKIASLVPVSNSSESVSATSDNGTGTNQTTTSLTAVDITNATLTLPTAGEWEIVFDGTTVSHSTTASVGVQITDMLGTVLASQQFNSQVAAGFSPVSVVVPSYTTATAKQVKAQFFAVVAGTATIRNSNTSPVKPRLFARKVGALSSIPGTVTDVSGAVSLASNQATAANTTPVDTGLSFLAPEAGTYEIEYEASVNNATAANMVDVWVADGNNNQQPESLKRGTGNVAGVITGSCRMIMAAGDVAKLRFASAGASVATMYGNATQGYGRLKWRKVAGYVPATANFEMPNAGATVTIANSVMQAGKITTVNLAANGNVDKPTTGANGAWFGVKVIGKPTTVRFGTAALPGTLRGSAQDYVIPGGQSGVVLFAFDGTTWDVIARDKKCERIQISRRGTGYGQSGGGAFATVLDANISDTSSLTDPGNDNAAVPFNNTHITFQQQTGTFTVGGNIVTVNRAGNYNFRVILSADCTSSANDAIALYLVRNRSAVRTLIAAQVGHSSEADGYGTANISIDFDAAVQEGDSFSLPMSNTAPADIALKSFLFRITEID